MVQKVLAALPREELRLVPQITAYPPAVRMAAKALVRRLLCCPSTLFIERRCSSGPLRG
jgi:hypothetical protein